MGWATSGRLLPAGYQSGHTQTTPLAIDLRALVGGVGDGCEHAHRSHTLNRAPVNPTCYLFESPSLASASRGGADGRRAGCGPGNRGKEGDTATAAEGWALPGNSSETVGPLLRQKMYKN